MKGSIRKKALLIVVLMIFVLPLLAAKVILDMGWYTKGVTNNGELLSDVVLVNWLENPGKWRLIYVFPASCTLECENAIFQLNQIPIAAGRERERVASILLISDSSLDIQAENITKQRLNSQEKQDITLLPFNEKAIYLVDPLGYVVLAYPLSSEKNIQISQSKGLLADLRKLMKLSKVG